MATGSVRKALIVGLGNYSLPDTRHNVGMMVLDHIVRWKGLAWTPHKKCKGWVTTVHESVMPPQPKKTRKIQQSKPVLAAFLSKQLSPPPSPNSSIPASVSVASTPRLSHPFHPVPTPAATIAPNPASVLQPEPVRWEITLLKPKVWMNESGQSVAKAVKELSIPLTNIIIIHDDMQRGIGKLSLKQGGSANGHNGIKSIIDHLRTHEFARLRVGIGRPPNDNRSQALVSNYVLTKFTPTELELLRSQIYGQCTAQWPGLFVHR